MHVEKRFPNDVTQTVSNLPISMVHAFHASQYYGIGRTEQAPPPMDIDYRVIRISFAAPPPPTWVRVNIMLLHISISTLRCGKYYICEVGLLDHKGE